MTELLQKKIEAFLATGPEAEERLDLFLGVGNLLYDTADVARMTGWSTAYVTRLCRQKTLPHIPGNPNKFILAHILAALESMQVGGKFGRKSGGTHGVQKGTGTVVRNSRKRTEGQPAA